MKRCSNQSIRVWCVWCVSVKHRFWVSVHWKNGERFFSRSLKVYFYGKFFFSIQLVSSSSGWTKTKKTISKNNAHENWAITITNNNRPWTWSEQFDSVADPERVVIVDEDIEKVHISRNVSINRIYRIERELLLAYQFENVFDFQGSFLSIIHGWIHIVFELINRFFCSFLFYFFVFALFSNAKKFRSNHSESFGE